jgi:hypothetical protein
MLTLARPLGEGQVCVPDAYQTGVDLLATNRAEAHATRLKDRAL